MGVWIGCLAMIAALPFARQILLNSGILLRLAACLPVAALAGFLFFHVAKRKAASHRCKTCGNRWRHATWPKIGGEFPLHLEGEGQGEGARTSVTYILTEPEPSEPSTLNFELW